MNYLSIDFETYCELNIKRVGAHKYVDHPSFEVMCMGYTINGRNPSLWLPQEGKWGGDIAKVFSDKFAVLAFNAEFEILVINKVYKQLGLNTPIPPEYFIDVQAVGKTYGFPANLEDLCTAVGVPGKTEGGKDLVRKLCSPRKPTKADKRTRWTYDMVPEDFDNLYKYCVNDVTQMNAAFAKLPAQRLTEHEQAVWLHTLKQNERGLPINLANVKSILMVIDQYKKLLGTELNVLTNGRITAGTQRQRIQDELNATGCDIPNLQGDTIKEYLDSHKLTKYQRRLLEIKRDTNHSSTGKYKRLIEMTMHDGRLRGAIKYFAQHLGRFGSYGFQLHNQPRAQFKNPLPVIGVFSSRNLRTVLQYHPRVMQAATKLIRPMIQAPHGKALAVSDFSSIENRILHWYAGDRKTLEEFGKGLDQYRTFAADRFNIKYLEVTSDQRQFAKPCVLGLGFGGGEGALARGAKNHGVSMSKQQLEDNVHFYRKVKYPMIPKMWYKTWALAIDTVLTGDPHVYKNEFASLEFSMVKYNGIVYLRTKLPSGRYIWYPDPKLREGKFNSTEITFMGVVKGMWRRQGLWYGMFTENFVQATARDLLAHSMLVAERYNYPCIGSVHDEAITEVYVSVEDSKELDMLLCVKPEWAETIPLQAKGYVGKHYKKD
jgi:DNA polymerase